jgi:hypothetical protein
VAPQLTFVRAYGRVKASDVTGVAPQLTFVRAYGRVKASDVAGVPCDRVKI